MAIKPIKHLKGPYFVSRSGYLCGNVDHKHIGNNRDITVVGIHHNGQLMGIEVQTGYGEPVKIYWLEDLSRARLELLVLYNVVLVDERLNDQS